MTGVGIICRSTCRESEAQQREQRQPQMRAAAVPRAVPVPCRAPLPGALVHGLAWQCVYFDGAETDEGMRPRPGSPTRATRQVTGDGRPEQAEGHAHVGESVEEL